MKTHRPSEQRRYLLPASPLKYAVLCDAHREWWLDLIIIAIMQQHFASQPLWRRVHTDQRSQSSCLKTSSNQIHNLRLNCSSITSIDAAYDLITVTPFFLIHKHLHNQLQKSRCKPWFNNDCSHLAQHLQCSTPSLSWHWWPATFVVARKHYNNLAIEFRHAYVLRETICRAAKTNVSNF